MFAGCDEMRRIAVLMHGMACQVGVGVSLCRSR